MQQFTHHERLATTARPTATLSRSGDRRDIIERSCSGRLSESVSGWSLVSFSHPYSSAECRPIFDLRRETASGHCPRPPYLFFDTS